MYTEKLATYRFIKCIACYNLPANEDDSLYATKEDLSCIQRVLSGEENMSISLSLTLNHNTLLKQQKVDKLQKATYEELYALLEHASGNEYKCIDNARLKSIIQSLAINGDTLFGILNSCMHCCVDSSTRKDGRRNIFSTHLSIGGNVYKHDRSINIESLIKIVKCALGHSPIEMIVSFQSGNYSIAILTLP